MPGVLVAHAASACTYPDAGKTRIFTPVQEPVAHPRQMFQEIFRLIAELQPAARPASMRIFWVTR